MESCLSANLATNWRALHAIPVVDKELVTMYIISRTRDRGNERDNTMEVSNAAKDFYLRMLGIYKKTQFFLYVFLFRYKIDFTVIIAE